MPQQRQEYKHQEMSRVEIAAKLKPLSGSKAAFEAST
jgi:hypothetical protein